MKLSNIKILYKVVLLLVALGGIAIFAAAFSTTKMSEIQQTYGQIVERKFPALISMARANRNIYGMMAASMRAMAYDEEAIDKEAKTLFIEQAEHAVERFETLAKNEPAMGDDLNPIIESIRAVEKQMSVAIDLSLAGKNLEALSASKPAYADTQALMKKITAVIEKYEAQNKKDSVEAAASPETAGNITLASVLGGLAVVLVAAIWMTLTAISRPLKNLGFVMERLAKGDLTVEINGQDRGDEVGLMSRAVGIFKTNAEAVKRMEAEVEAAEEKAEAERKKSMLDLADTFEQAVGGIVSIVAKSATELQAAAQTLTASATQTTMQSTAVAAASEEASTNVSTVASATSELAASVQEISRQVQQSSSIAGKAVKEASETTVQVQALATAAGKIGSILSLINQIAGKTNLLALNATIEAARAGEAGKGFAVVAQEVKALADQTAKATAEIEAQIGAIQGSTQQAANAIDAIGSTIKEIDQIAATIAAAVEEQGAATEEIARNVEQASAGTSEVSSNINGVSRAASDSNDAAVHVLSSANALSSQSERLRVEMNRFLTNVRAA